MMGRLRRMTGGASVAPLLILFGLNAVDELDRVAFTVLLPEIRDAFGLDNQGILTLLSLTFVVALGLQPLVGYLADRTDRIRLASLGAVCWAGFTLLTGLAPSLVVLGVARAGSAIGKLVNDPTHNSLLSDYYPPEVRTSVFGFHRAGNSLGQIVGPPVAGVLALWLGWRAPFFLFAIPTVVLVVLAVTRLRPPVRGGHDRRALGADTEAADVEERPPGLGESWRICHQVRTLRRIFYAYPFLAVSTVGLLSLTSLLYEDVFGLNEAERGLISGIAEPLQLVGILVGVPLAGRLARRDEGLVLKLVAVAGGVSAACLAGFALAPNLPVAIAMNMLASAVLGVLSPGILAVLSLVIPPRARAMGFSISSLYILPGLLMLIVVGGLADAIGIRGGLLVLVPVLAAGCFIVASAGTYVAADIHRVRASSLAQAEARRARMAGDPKLLIVRDLDVSYGQVQVLFGVNLHVDEGEIVALLGTNGAGKSTLLNAVAGIVEANGGAVVYDGVDITMVEPERTVAEGVVLVPGGKGVFPTLTVRENFELAMWLFRGEPDYAKAALEEVLGYFPVLRSRMDQKAGNLSGGEQQMLTLGQAFITRPKLLMIDELSLGLAPVIVEQLLAIVRAIHERGATVIVVEQSVNVAMTLARRAVFMEKGEVRFDGPTAELLERPDILRAVFLQGSQPRARRSRAVGRRAYAASCAACGHEHPVALETDDLSVAFGGIRAVNGVSLSVRQGQILGLIGPNGAGKTTLFDLLSGYVVPETGVVRLAGTDVTALGPDERARLGLGRSFQDSRLFPSLTVREAIAVARERHVRTRDPLAAALASPATRMAEQEVAAEVDRLIELMHLERYADNFVGELSTGSRRVVDLACSMAHDPQVLLLDEPSSGIAQRETEALAPLLVELRDRTGAALVVIEHDMPLITAVSDELVALELGSVIARGAPRDVVADPRVVESYLGGTEAVINRSKAKVR